MNAPARLDDDLRVAGTCIITGGSAAGRDWHEDVWTKMCTC